MPRKQKGVVSSLRKGTRFANWGFIYRPNVPMRAKVGFNSGAAKVYYNESHGRCATLTYLHTTN